MITRQTASDDSLAQLLCMECGLCCNGTLFSHVPLTEDDLAPRPADRIVLANGQIGLAQSCRYYRKKLCAIYHTGRPRSCVTFQCKLLHAHARGVIAHGNALDEIHKTAHLVERVTVQLRAPSVLRARNLTEQFKAWLYSAGGCFAEWSNNNEITLQNYSALLSHLQHTFGLAHADEQEA